MILAEISRIKLSQIFQNVPFLVTKTRKAVIKILTNRAKRMSKKVDFLRKKLCIFQHFSSLHQEIFHLRQMLESQDFNNGAGQSYALPDPRFYSLINNNATTFLTFHAKALQKQNICLWGDIAF